MDDYETVCAENAIRSADELADALQDYAAQARQLSGVIKHFQVAEKPVCIGNGTWICPSCQHRINPFHSYCHWCGKKLGGFENGRRRDKR